MGGVIRFVYIGFLSTDHELSLWRVDRVIFCDCLGWLETT